MDAISVGIFIQELQHEPFNPVLLYEPQRIEKSYLKRTCSLDLSEHLKQILCIDDTHSSTAYRFKLITHLVQDEFNQRCPINKNQ